MASSGLAVHKLEDFLGSKESEQRQKSLSQLTDSDRFLLQQQHIQHEQHLAGDQEF